MRLRPIHGNFVDYTFPCDELESNICGAWVGPDNCNPSLLLWAVTKPDCDTTILKAKFRNVPGYDPYFNAPLYLSPNPSTLLDGNKGATAVGGVTPAYVIPDITVGDDWLTTTAQFDLTIQPGFGTVGDPLVTVLLEACDDPPPDDYDPDPAPQSVGAWLFSLRADLTWGVVGKYVGVYDPPQSYSDMSPSRHCGLLENCDQESWLLSGDPVFQTMKWRREVNVVTGVWTTRLLPNLIYYTNPPLPDYDYEFDAISELDIVSGDYISNSGGYRVIFTDNLDCDDTPPDINCVQYACFPTCLVKSCPAPTGIAASLLFLNVTSINGCCLNGSYQFTWEGTNYYSGKIGDENLIDCGYVEIWYECQSDTFRRRVKITDVNGVVSETTQNDPGACVDHPPTGEEFEDSFDVMSSILSPICFNVAPFFGDTVTFDVFTNNGGGA